MTPQSNVPTSLRQRLGLNLSPVQRAAYLQNRLSSLSLNGYGVLGYVFLYAPILIVVVFSFNAGRSTSTMDGFSLRWYEEMMQDGPLLQSMWNSVFVALVSALIATVFGTLAAIGMERYRFRGRLAVESLIYLPIVIPDIAMAIMLLVFFSLSGIGFEPWRLNLLGVRLAVPFSVIIGHVAFNISFVIVIVRARLARIDSQLEEAARDLYANTWKTFTRVTLPMLMPGIMGGALLAFTLSLDDFIITFFVSGAGFSTLPTYVYGMIKRGITPKINAVSTILLFASLILVLLSIALRKDESKEDMDLGL